MKKFRPSTWIAIGCVALAIIATQTYNSLKNVSRQGEEQTATITESFPSPPSPIATPATEHVTATPTPKPTDKPINNEADAAPVNATMKSIPASSPDDFFLPSSGEVSASYSDKVLVFFEPLDEWRCHLGIDFLPSETDTVLAVADGIVETIYDDHLFGTTVVIEHGNGLKSLYSSLSSVSAAEGSTVTAGAEIGKMGETADAENGVHLHFSMEKDGKPIDPLCIK
ncbi:MAG: M23 family metallopeptidase [Ruminococcaceae bacterium]|nr:M23 family metallopeptidase [Oscillospiraceae bacterium]